MRPRETLLVAAREVREAVRSRWFLLSAVSFLVLSLGGLGLAGELEDGSLAVLLAQPLTRGEVYLGKYLGLLGAVGASIFAGFGAAGLVITAVAGGGNAVAFLQLVGLAVLLAAATLALGTLLSAALSSRAKAVGGAFAAWLVIVYGSDLGAIGLAAARSLSPAQVFALALLNPVEQARVLGTLSLTSRPDVLGVVGVYGQDLLGANGLPLVLIGALLASASIALGLGWVVFRKAAVP